MWDPKIPEIVSQIKAANLNFKASQQKSQVFKHVQELAIIFVRKTLSAQEGKCQYFDNPHRQEDEPLRKELFFWLAKFFKIQSNRKFK